MSAPSLEETLKLARSLTHSGFTQSKADLVVAGIEQGYVEFGLGFCDGTPGARGYVQEEGAGVINRIQDHLMAIALTDEVGALHDPDVADDEIDEDPAPGRTRIEFVKEEIDLFADVYLELRQIGSDALASKVAALVGLDDSVTEPGDENPTIEGRLG